MILAAAAALAAAPASAQTQVMVVHQPNGSAVEFEVEAVDSVTFRDSPWVSLGMCEYTEDFMTTFWYVDNVTYGVEVQENGEQPGLYRLVNPYGEAYPYNSPGMYDETMNHYMEIHAGDPDGVYISEFLSGLDWYGYGDIYMYSTAGYEIEVEGYSLEAVKADGMCGTLSDGTITFPKDQLLISMPGSSYGPYYYTANSYRGFKVVLPDAAGGSPAGRATGAEGLAPAPSSTKEGLTPTGLAKR